MAETDLIALASIISATVAIIVAGLLLFDWNRTKKQQRLDWGIGMVTYAIGHFIVFLIYFGVIPSPNVDLFIFTVWLWIYINLGGAITMALILKGLLPLFTEKKNWVRGIPLAFALFYIIGSLLYGFVLPSSNILNFIMLGVFLCKSYSQVNNMSWFVVECLIPVSLVIGVLFIVHYRKRKALSSLLIAVHFIGYALLLFIWPFDEYKLLFYAGRTVITTVLAIGFIDLIKRT